jgi:hypothetical protein
MLSFDSQIFAIPRRARACLLIAVVVYIALYCVSFASPLGLSELVPTWAPKRAGDRDADGGLESMRTDAAQHGQRSRASIGKVTMLYGELSSVYERAVASHDAHAKRHGYPMYVLREQLLDGLWSKPAYLMAVVTAELQKPREERLEWLL